MKWLLIGGAGLGLWWYLSRATDPCADAWAASVGGLRTNLPPGMTESQTRETFLRHCRAAPESAKSCFRLMGSFAGGDQSTEPPPACMAVFMPMVMEVMGTVMGAPENASQAAAGFGGYVRG